MKRFEEESKKWLAILTQMYVLWNARNTRYALSIQPRAKFQKFNLN
jgi:hypothetical protein